jgi:uncharacterized protein with GYD domain
VESEEKTGILDAFSRPPANISTFSEGNTMTRFLSLLSFTEQGIRSVKQTVKRANDFRAKVEAAGGKVLSQYWALGDADGCVIFEAPDEATGASLLLALSQLGNVRTRTLTIYNEQEFAKVLANA